MDRILDVLPAFGRACSTMNIGDATRDRYLGILEAFARWLDPDDATIDDIVTDLIIDYQAELKERGQAKRTIRLTLSAIRAFCRWCIRQRKRVDDPTLGVTWPKIPKTKGRALQLRELQQLVALMRSPMPRRKGLSRWQWERNIRLFQLMIYAGLRLSEACALLWEDVDLGFETLTVRYGKGEKDRVLPLHRQLLATLERVPSAERHGPVIGSERGRDAKGRRRPLSATGADKVFSRWLPMLGVKGLTAHRLRHTCAELMRRFGADLKDIQEVLGHESLETTEGYLGADPEHLRLAVEAMPDLEGLAEYQPPRLRVMRMRGKKLG
jgi:integrase/recombinase XerC